MLWQHFLQSKYNKYVCDFIDGLIINFKVWTYG